MKAAKDPMIDESIEDVILVNLCQSSLSNSSQIIPVMSKNVRDCETFMMVMMMTSMFQDFKMFLRCFVAILYSLRFVWHGAHASSTWVAVKVGKNCGRH